VAGFSNGAMMTQRLVVDYPDQYKAMAVVGGAIGGYNGLIGPPNKSINALFINGEQGYDRTTKRA
jgi:poly(3-hydroxybutyrate) depolymerase